MKGRESERKKENEREQGERRIIRNRDGTGYPRNVSGMGSEGGRRGK